MIHFTSTRFYPAEIMRFHGAPGFSSSAEDEFSSDSSEGNNPPRPHSMASPSEHRPIDNDDDDNIYPARSPSADELSNNSSYGGRFSAPTPVPAPRPACVARFIASSVPTDNSGMASQMIKTSPMAIRYCECMKNHAANLGGHALDGCGEFLPSGPDGFDALICSACGCHRNFHRREVEGEHVCSCNKRMVEVPSNNSNIRGVSGPPTPGLLGMPSSRDIAHHQPDLPASPPHFDDADLPVNSSSRKRRHRTKFSEEQKERMFSFAESLGWRTAKQNDASVQQFCNDIGVKRSVFKVWMHNNKHHVAKRLNMGEPSLVGSYESPSDY